MPILTNEIEQGIVCVTLSNPSKRNALDLPMLHSLERLWPELEEDRNVRAVIITGDGPHAFCSGADLSGDLDELAGIDELVENALLKTTCMSKPLISAICGACVAGGLELALSTDIRIAADDATLGLPEVRWGIVPSGGGAMKLVDQIGLAKAIDLLLTGRLVSGREADEIGLVSHACSADEVFATACARARMIAANSPSAVVATKRAALERRSLAYQRLESTERELVAQVRASGDPSVGKAAFLSRRTPTFDAAAPALMRTVAGNDKGA